MLNSKFKMVSDMLNEKAVSKSQQKFFGMVSATQDGKLKNPSKAVKDAADSMSVRDVDDFAETKHTGLPETK